MRSYVDTWSSRQEGLNRARQYVEDHRRTHECGLSLPPPRDVRLAAALATRIQAARVLILLPDLGCAAASLARAVKAGGSVETYAPDDVHAAFARKMLSGEPAGERVMVLPGHVLALLPAVASPYDLIWLDGSLPATSGLLAPVMRLTHPGSIVLSSNLFPPPTSSLLAPAAAEHRWRIETDGGFFTAYLKDGFAMSVCLSPGADGPVTRFAG